MWRAAAALCLAGLLAACASRMHGVRPLYDAAVDGRPGAGIEAPLVVELADGVRPLVKAIDQAQTAIYVETYILSDSRLVRALERAASQGVAVYVLLEHHPYGLPGQPDRVAAALRAAGVYVRWTRPDVALTHAKFLVLDDRMAVVGTANLSRAAFSHNREFLVFLTARWDVHAVANIFRADWNRVSALLGDHDLAVSPSNARRKLAALVAGARHSIAIYGEEMADARIERQLVQAAERGVSVRVLLPPRVDAADVRYLLRGGVRVRALRSPYIHAKMVLIDGREAMVGSINLSTQSLDRNRELSVLVRGSDAQMLSAVFRKDWRHATSP